MHTWIVLLVLLTQNVTTIKRTYSSFQEVDNELSRQRESQRKPRFRIGLLTLTFTPTLRKHSEERYRLAEENEEDALDFYTSHSFVASSYVKWLKTKDVEVIIIDINQSDEDIAAMLETLNGVVLTGGANSIFQARSRIHIDDENSIAVEVLKPTYYALKVSAIVDKAKEINTRRVFGVWGTCLGFESILIKESDFKARLDNINNINRSSAIHLTDNTSFSSFLNQYQDVKAKLESEELVYFNHNYGFFSSTFQNTESLRSKYDVLAVSHNSQGEQFIEMVKNKNYPIFAIQSHPEKNAFEDAEKLVINRSSDAIKISELILEYFLNQLGDWKYDYHNQHDEYSEMVNLINQDNVIECGPVGPFNTVFIFNGRKFLLKR